jgi:hypothetical protein
LKCHLNSRLNAWFDPTLSDLIKSPSYLVEIFRVKACYADVGLDDVLIRTSG